MLTENSSVVISETQTVLSASLTVIIGNLSVSTRKVILAAAGVPPVGQITPFILANASLLTSVVALRKTGAAEAT